MNGQEYLNRISKETAPVKKPKKNIFQSKFFVVGAVGVILLVLIMIVGAILSSGGDDQSRTFALKLHLSGTMEVMGNYQTKVKSSDLRSNGSSFYSVLSTTDTNLTNYITEKYDYSEKKVDKKLQSEADAEREELDNTLFEAKINGILDRIYAHKMAFEVSKFMSEAEKIARTTKNETLKELMNSLYGNLMPLYERFDEFSQGK